jgi:hypothetical protein
MDLTHRMTLKKIEQAKIESAYIDSRKTSDDTLSMPTGNTNIPHSKRNPPSMYNSSKNHFSFEHAITKQEIERRLEQVIDYTGVMLPAKKAEIAKLLYSCFKNLSESEIK